MGRASQVVLDAAHGFLIDTLLREIREYRSGKVIDPRTGAPVRCPPALYSELSKMLKINSVDRPGQVMDPDAESKLLAEMPEMPEIDEFGDYVPEYDESVLPMARTPKVSEVDKINTSWCTTCKTRKDRSEFNTNNSTPSGLQRSCRECQRVTQAEYRKRKAAEKEKADGANNEGSTD